MLGAGSISGDEGQVDVGGGHTGQLNLCLFSSFLQTLHRHLIAGQVYAGLHLEGAYQPIHDALVEVVAAQTVVTSGCQNFLHTVAHLDDGHIEGTAAQVIHHDLLLFALVDAIGQCSCGRFVDDTLDIQTGNLACVLGCLTLCVGEICGNRDNSGSDSLAQIGFSVCLQFLQDHCGNLLGGILFAVDAYLVIGTHLSLNGRNGAVGVGDSLTLCNLANHTLAVFRESNNRRSGAGAFGVCNHNGLAAFNNSDAGVCSTKVNTDSLRHNSLPPCNAHLYACLLYLNQL